MIGIIAAVSQNGVIGTYDQNGKGSIPWHYKADMQYFRETTVNSAIIFGRKTFETIEKALPKRRNIVISSTKIDVEGIEIFSNIEEAIQTTEKSNIWFAGGAGIYQEGMEYADTIHLTITPDVITGNNVVKFPWINPCQFQLSAIHRTPFPETDQLKLCVYKRY